MTFRTINQPDSAARIIDELRSVGVTYTNTTGKPIVISCGGVASLFGNFLTLAVDGVQSASFSGIPASSQYVGLQGIVPNNSTYIVTISGGTISGFFFRELR